MPTYRVKMPDGSEFDVTSPDGREMSEDQIMAALGSNQKMSKSDVTVGRSAAAADAVLLGAGDEYLSSVGALLDTAVSDQGQGWMLPSAGDTFSKNYNRRLQDLRGIQQRYATERPVENIGITLAAGLPTALATGGPALSAVRGVAPGLGSVGQAAGVGGIYGGLTGFNEGEGGVGNRLASGAVGAGVGAVTGAALEGVVMPAVARLAEAVRGRPQLFDPQRLTLTVEGERVARRAGLDPTEANAALQREFAQLARNAVDPADAGRVAEASTLPVRVPLTRGQSTLDPSQQMFESQAGKGVYGVNAQVTMQDFMNAQQEALRGNVQSIKFGIGGDSVRDFGEGVQRARDTLVRSSEALRARTNQLYQAARESAGDAFVLGNNVADGLAGIRQTLDADGFTARTAPRVHGLIEDVAQDLLTATQQVGKNPDISVANVFGIRQQLAALSRSSDAVEAAAAGNAKRAIDRFMNDAIADDLIRGDAAVVELWRRAIASRAEMARRFGGKDLVSKLVERGPNGAELKLDSNAAVNLIFGGQNTGWVGRSGMVDGLRRLRQELGENSVGWNALREEVFMRLAREGTKGAQANNPAGGTFSGAQFQTAWRTMQDKSPEVVGMLFTPQERQLISQFARVANRVTSYVPGGVNRSDTSAGIADFTKRLWNSTFLGPRMAAFLEGVPVLKGLSNLGNELRVTAAVQGGFPTAVPQPTPIPLRPEVPALGGAAASQQFNQ